MKIINPLKNKTKKKSSLKKRELAKELLQRDSNTRPHDKRQEILPRAESNFEHTANHPNTTSYKSCALTN
jgi:hypothetical protein